ncbi:MAG TPA: hypothetical protein VN889_05650 [Solirubrobacteraceae bacterium]|nr:hypothetical protein [Solirubrobacteraceae bacterium]
MTAFGLTFAAVTAAAAAGGGIAAASASASAPSCAPTTLNSSAIKAGAVTVSPLSGSRDATPATQISFLGVPARALSHVSVIGSASGAHRGRLLAYSQGDGASFVPSRPFVEGERVVVRAELSSGASKRPLLDVFAIAEQDRITTTPERTYAGEPSEVQAFRSRPDLRPPALTVTASSPAVAPGDELVAPYTGPGQAGPMIVDGAGGLVWFKPLPANTFATNFRVQQYAGEPALTCSPIATSASPGPAYRANRPRSRSFARPAPPRPSTRAGTARRSSRVGACSQERARRVWRRSRRRCAAASRRRSRCLPAPPSGTSRRRR